MKKQVLFTCYPTSFLSRIRPFGIVEFKLPNSGKRLQLSIEVTNLYTLEKGVMMSVSFSRKVKCKECGFEGVVEAHDTKTYPKNDIFELLGKDNSGYIHLQCPSCKMKNSYSPLEFIGAKSSRKLGCFLIMALAIVAIWLFFR